MLLGVAAALGNLGSAWFVYWRVMHTKKDSVPLLLRLRLCPATPSPEMLDAASRPRFHLSRAHSCPFREVELVSGAGRDRRTDLLFALVVPCGA